MTTLGDRIRAAAKMRGMSLFDVAHAAGMSDAQLQKVLSGTTKSPGIRVLARIAHGARVTVDYLLLGVEDIEGPDDLSVDELAEIVAAVAASKGLTLKQVAAMLERSEKVDGQPLPARSKAAAKATAKSPPATEQQTETKDHDPLKH